MLKNELKKLKYNSRIIDEKNRTLFELKEKLKNVQGFNFSALPKNKNSNKSFENLLVKIIDMEKEITKDIDLLIDEKKEAEKLFKEHLDGSLYLVMYMRYINFSKWEDIAESLNYSLVNIYKLHGKALKILESNKRV